jgi:hypothetical protein
MAGIGIRRVVQRLRTTAVFGETIGALVDRRLRDVACPTAAWL